MQPIPDMHLLFVYGSLRAGSDHPNAARLAQESAWLGKATLTGTLYRVDWHPALVLEGSDTITGDLLHLHDSASSLPWLDEFEGCAPDDPHPHDYRRELCNVIAPAGAVAALTYIWNLPVTALARIPSGDWLAG